LLLFIFFGAAEGVFEDLFDPFEVGHGVGGEVGSSLVVVGEGKDFADVGEEFRFGLAGVGFDNFDFLCECAAAAGEGVDGLAGHFVDFGVESRWDRVIELVILEEIVGSLAVAVDGEEPSGEGAVAVFGEELLGALDPLAVEQDGLVGDRLHLGGDGHEGGEVRGVVGCLVAVGFEERFEGLFFLCVEGSDPEHTRKTRELSTIGLFDERRHFRQLWCFFLSEAGV